MIDNFRPNVNVANDPRKPSGLPKTITMAKAIVYINSIQCEEEVKKKLIRKIGSYPANTLGVILKNINEIIMRVRQEMSDEKKVKSEKPEEKKNDPKPEEKKKDEKGQKHDDKSDKKPEPKEGKGDKHDDKSDKKPEAKPEEQEPKDPRDRQDERHDALENDPLEAGQSGVDRRRGHVPDENGQPIDQDGGAGHDNHAGGLDHRLPDPAYPLRGQPSPDPIDDRGLQVDP